MGCEAPTARRRSLALLAVACLSAALAACGGGDERAAKESDRAKAESEQALSESTRIGDPLLATNAPSEESEGLFEGETAPDREGLVEGTPSDDELDELPPAVGLGSRSSGCQNASLQPTAGNLAQLEAPIRCLLNAERRARGLGSLRSDDRLRNAALGHSRDMVVKRYFAHRSQSGSSPAARIRAAGWIPRQGRWIVGENIAWGSGSLAAPSKIVRAWMASPGHRANILRRSFREFGVGVALGVPSGSGSGATFNTAFGGRP